MGYTCNHNSVFKSQNPIDKKIKGYRLYKCEVCGTWIALSNVFIDD